MKHSTKVYCSNIIKDLVPAAKAYEDKVISIGKKFGKDLAKVEQDAAEIYAPSPKQDLGVMAYYDNQARRKAEEAQRAEEKVLNDRRTVYVNSKLETLAPAARKEIRSAQAEFQEAARKVAKDLREHLEKDVATPLKPEFLHFARVFNEFGIPLTDLDCDALLTFSDDNPTAYRVIESIIKKTNSPYTFSGKGTDSYAEDIRFIENLASDAFAAPQEVFHEINELFNGTPVYEKKSDSPEDRIKSSMTFDATQLSMQSGAFTYGMEKLGKISEDWSADAKVEYDPTKAMIQEKAQSAGNQAKAHEALGAYMK